MKTNQLVTVTVVVLKVEDATNYKVVLATANGVEYKYLIHDSFRGEVELVPRKLYKLVIEHHKKGESYGDGKYKEEADYVKSVIDVEDTLGVDYQPELDAKVRSELLKSFIG